MPVKLWAAAALALTAVAHGKAVHRRNRTLVRPPIRDASGSLFPTEIFQYSDGEQIAYVDVGEGTPILWVPGADGVKETWRYQLPDFSPRYRTVAPDLRENIAPDHTFDRLVDDLLELVDGLDTGPVILVGQSLGGAIAMRFASRYPDRVRALVVCNSLTRVSYRHVGLNRTSLVPLAIATTRYLPTWAAAKVAAFWSRLSVWIYDDSPGRDRLIEYALWTGPRTVPPRISTARVDLLKGRDLRSELPSITAPTLVIKGSKDRYCPVEWSLDIAAAIPGARYAPMPETGHCSHISMPQSFNRLLLSWLDEVMEVTRCSSSTAL